VILTLFGHERSCPFRARLDGHLPLKLVLEVARELDDQAQLPLAENRYDDR